MKRPLVEPTADEPLRQDTAGRRWLHAPRDAQARRAAAAIAVAVTCTDTGLRVPRAPGRAESKGARAAAVVLSRGVERPPRGQRRLGTMWWARWTSCDRGVAVAGLEDCGIFFLRIGVTAYCTPMRWLMMVAGSAEADVHVGIDGGW